MLSVIIPALNEELAIEETIRAISTGLEAEGVEHEIIVVNDGSKDRTGELARRAGARVIDHPKPAGYGKSLKDGILSSKYDLIGITDADGTYPNAKLPELYRLVVVNGFDMAVGARTGDEYRGTFLKMPARRLFLWLCEYATGSKIDDINSGLRVFRRELALRFIHTISNGFSFTTTITLAAMLNGYFVIYIPIEYYKRVGSSHVRYWRDTLRAFQIIVENILYYNPLKLFLLLCRLLFALGVSGFALMLLVKRPPFDMFFAILAAFSLVACFIVAAVGFSAALDSISGHHRHSRDVDLAGRLLESRKGASTSLRPHSAEVGGVDAHDERESSMAAGLRGGRL